MNNIIAIHILGFSNPRYVSHYEKLNGQAIILMSPKREEAATFSNENVIEVQRNIRDSIYNYIVHGGANMLAVLKETTAVLVEKLHAPKKQIVVRLAKIVRENNPEEQTIAFAQGVDEWMKQWTVANNYKMSLTDDPKKALRIWWEDFAGNVERHFGRLCKNLDIAAQFSFEYEICEIKEDGMFWPSGLRRKVLMSDVLAELEEIEDGTGDEGKCEGDEDA
jgi:hypothetical protein